MEQDKNLASVGIDVSKDKLDVALLRAPGKFRDKVVGNNRKGFEELRAWLAKHGITQAHICMEATGSYWEELAEFLADAGFAVSVVNPMLVKKYGESLGERNKTDRVDARVIAKFCAERVPQRWQAPSKAMRGLRALVRRREALVGLRTEELNRRDSASDPLVLSSIGSVIAHLDKQIELIERQIRDHIDGDPTLKSQCELLNSVPGIGAVTSAMLLSYYGGDQARFSSSKQAVAFAGLDPCLRESGTSVKGRPRISKKGHAGIRATLYMPAVSAMRTSWGKTFADRLKAAGKPGLVVVGAVMRKLVSIAFGVLKSGKPFNPALHGA